MSAPSTWERDVLRYWPYDDRDMRVKLFSDRIITVRYIHRCFTCGAEIIAGSVARAIREAWDGRAITTYFCKACCDAMAVSWKDNGRAIEERVGRYIRQRNVRELLGLKPQA